MENKSNEQEIELEGEETLKIDCLESEPLDYPDISIKIEKENFTVFEMKRRIQEKKTLKLDPDFQRNFVWNPKQKSELIESILMGIPIPIIYLFEDERGMRQVVDGRQRLTCICKYIDNEFKLSKLDILKKENNNFFKDLSPQMQSKIEDYQITTYTIQPPTPEKVKFNIFDRVNRGGTRLNNQEMRNAIYLGEATKLLNKLSESKEFLDATGNSIPSKAMKDKYIILRFIAFYLYRTKHLKEEYKSNLEEFLATAMKTINKYNDQQIKELETIFKLSMKNCYEILGADGFRFNKNAEQRRPINMGLFESLGYLLSIELPKFLNKKDLKKEIDKLKIEMDDSGKFRIIDSNISIDYRFDKADEMRRKLQND